MLNKVILAGRLTHDPETVKSGETTIVHMRLAVDRDYKRKGEPDADFFDLSAFGKTAEICAEHLRKGSKIDVEGRLKLRQWEDKDGKKRSSIEVSVSGFHFLDAKAQMENQAPQGYPSNAPQMPYPQTGQYQQAVPPAPQGYPAPAPTMQGYPAAAPQPAMAAAPQGHPAPAQPTAQYPGFPGVTGYPAPQYGVAGTSALDDDVPF